MCSEWNQFLYVFFLYSLPLAAHFYRNLHILFELFCLWRQSGAISYCTTEAFIQKEAVLGYDFE